MFSSWVRSFGTFQAGHGWLVNFVVVVLLVGVGACFLSGNLRLIRIGVVVGAVLCLADWVLVEDLGFFGGVGTDPNSMIPMALVFTGGYVAWRASRSGPRPATLSRQAPAGAPVVGSRDRRKPSNAPEGAVAPTGWLDRLTPSYLLRSLLAVGAVGILLVGVGPMAVAATNPNADPIVTEAANGSPNVVDVPAAPFTLTDQHGRHGLPGVVGRSHRGAHLPRPGVHVGLPADRPGAPADRPDARDRVPVRSSWWPWSTTRCTTRTAVTNAFDRQEGLDHLANWTYLTGSLGQLHKVWNDYGVQTQVTPAGAMIAHSDIVYIIDRSGHTREILNSDPGDGSAAGKSSFSALLAGQVQHVAQS